MDPRLGIASAHREQGFRVIETVRPAHLTRKVELRKLLRPPFLDRALGRRWHSLFHLVHVDVDFVVVFLGEVLDRVPFRTRLEHAHPLTGGTGGRRRVDQRHTRVVVAAGNHSHCGSPVAARHRVTAQGLEGSTIKLGKVTIFFSFTVEPIF